MVNPVYGAAAQTAFINPYQRSGDDQQQIRQRDNNDKQPQDSGRLTRAQTNAQQGGQPATRTASSEFKSDDRGQQSGGKRGSLFDVTV